MAVPAFQRPELDDPRRVPGRGVPHAGVGQPGDERARGAQVLAAVLPHLRGAVGGGHHGRGLPGHEQCRECVGGEGGVAVLETRGGERDGEGVVLGGGVAAACVDGVGDGAQEGAVGGGLGGGGGGGVGGGGGGRGECGEGRGDEEGGACRGA